MEKLICYNLIGVVSLTFIIYFIQNNVLFDRYKIKYFKYTVSLNLCLILLDCIDYIFSFEAFQEAYLLRNIVNALYYALFPLVPMLFIMIYRGFIHHKLILLPVCINFVLSIFSIVTGWVYIVDINNVFYRGILNWLPHFTTLTYLMYVLFLSRKHLSSGNDSESILLNSIVFVLIISLFLEIFVGIRFLVCNICAICQIIYYLFLHVQFFKQDALTGAYNRSVFEEDLKKYRNEDCVIVVCDMNNLKYINDNYGHVEGDEALFITVQNINLTFDGFGKVYRIGGDEFVIVVLDIDVDFIYNALNKINNDLVIASGSKAYEISVSSGFAIYLKNSGIDIHDIFSQADNMMYDEKKKKRKRM